MENLTPENFFLIFQVFIKVLVIWSPVLFGTWLYMYYVHPKRTTKRNKGKKIMRAGEVYEWLDQGPAVLLAPCMIADPIPMEKATEFSKDPEGFLQNWPRAVSYTHLALQKLASPGASGPREEGWTIKLLVSGDILDVHADTLTYS